ncbi:MAG: DUF3499 domain-containing protein [Sporichthyaceae bacterium]
MLTTRRCSRNACQRPATATLTYVYRDSTAVLGPLATYAEPHCYDLCQVHAERLTAPRGWSVVRLDPSVATGPSTDDLEALADLIRETGKPRGEEPLDDALSGARRGHLRAVRTPVDY